MKFVPTLFVVACVTLTAGVPQTSGPSPATPLADGDFRIKPPYVDAFELKVRDGVPRGTVHEFNPEISRGAWEYHATLIPQSDRKPIRVWMHVGENDNGSTCDEGSLHNWVLANQRMVAALKTKGYHYRFVFAAGSGHTDQAVINQTLPEALIYLWQDYETK